MTDELFDYFGKGSKKFEPLDDDLDLPEVSPKRNADAKSAANEQEASVQDEISADAEPVADATGDGDDDIFAGFGAGLFEDSTETLPPRKQTPKVKSAAPPKVATKTKPTAKADSKPAAPKRAKQEVAAVEQSESTDDSEGGTWDFIAGVLGIGGKKSKPAEATIDDTVQAKVKQPVVESKAKPKNISSADTIRETPQESVDALFNSTDDELDLAGWGDEPEEPVAVEDPVAPANDSDRSRPGRGRRPKRNRKDRPSQPHSDAPVDDESSDDENFIEFEVEELTPSARRDKKEDSSTDRPRRRRRPARNDEQEPEPRERRPRARKDSDNDSESRSRSGRGRNRSRSRGQDNDRKDRETSSKETVARSSRDTGSDDWQDEKPDTPSRNERSRGSRGRGRKRPQRQAEESKQVDDDFIDEDLEVLSFTDGDDDDFDKEAPSKKSRRPRRSRGRNRNDDDRDTGEKEIVSRGDSKRGDRDSESSGRRRRGSRGNRERDSSRNEKPPQYAEVPTWDETIESMIASNIKNHESNSNRGRGGRNSGGRNNNSGRSRGGNNRNGGGRNRR